MCRRIPSPPPPQFRSAADAIRIIAEAAMVNPVADAVTGDIPLLTIY